MGPMVTPTLFVDDLSIEMAGGDIYVMKDLVKFIAIACRDIEVDGTEVIRTNSVCTASHDDLGRRITMALREHGVC